MTDVSTGVWLGKNQKEIQNRTQKLNNNGDITTDIEVDGQIIASQDVTADNLIAENSIVTNDGFIFSQSYAIDSGEWYTADGSIRLQSSFAILDGASDTVNLSLSNVGSWLGRLLIVTCTDSTNTCSLTIGSGTFDGTNNKAVFESGDSLALFGVSSSKFIVMENDGVVLSSV